MAENAPPDKCGHAKAGICRAAWERVLRRWPAAAHKLAFPWWANSSICALALVLVLASSAAAQGRGLSDPLQSVSPGLGFALDAPWERVPAAAPIEPSG